MRSVVAYLAALLAGLSVLWIATPLLAVLGVSGMNPSGLAFVIGFAVLASVVPYLAARLVLSQLGLHGQHSQIVAGIVTVALTVLLLDFGFSGNLSPFTRGARSALGIMLAGGVAGFVHHAILSAGRKTI